MKKVNVMKMMKNEDDDNFVTENKKEFRCNDINKQSKKG